MGYPWPGAERAPVPAANCKNNLTAEQVQNIIPPRMDAELSPQGQPNHDVLEWLVVRTKPRQERIAMSHLDQRGVEPYCPLFLEPPWHPRAPRGPMPLFAGYIFVACCPREELNAVRYCPGILAPVSFAGNLATVHEAFIQNLRARESVRGYIVADDFNESIPKGQRVKVMGGPLRGLEGVFSGYLKGGQRARVLLEFLRTRRRIEVDVTALSVMAS